jgi:hypothetical protein
MSEAQHKAQGIVGISLIVQIGDTPNPELRIITSTFNKVLYKGENHQQLQAKQSVKNLNKNEFMKR